VAAARWGHSDGTLAPLSGFRPPIGTSGANQAGRSPSTEPRSPKPSPLLSVGVGSAGGPSSGTGPLGVAAATGMALPPTPVLQPQLHQQQLQLQRSPPVRDGRGAGTGEIGAAR
jgi:hypothetical protein